MIEAKLEGGGDSSNEEVTEDDRSPPVKSIQYSIEFDGGRSVVG